MTKEQKIEAISNEIREALPYLMNIEVGQIFFSTHFYRNVIAIDITSVTSGFFITHYLDDIGEIETEFYPDNLTLIGKEPMLNDVLAWLVKIDSPFFYISISGFFTGNGNIISSYSWNLTKPYLKDQSVELINFLYSLIEQK